MTPQNLLENKEDGLGKHIKVFRLSEFPDNESVVAHVTKRMQECKEICVFVDYVNVVDPGQSQRLLFCYGTDLVLDSVMKGNDAIVGWLNSELGTYYQEAAFSHLGIPRLECSVKIVLFQ